MSEWFYQFHKKLLEFSPALWIALAVLVAGGVGLAVLLKNKENRAKNKWFIVGVSAVIVAALAVVAAVAIPPAELEEGTPDLFLYQGWFWTALLCVVLVVILVLLLKKQVWTAKMLSVGAVCVAVAVILSAIRLYRMPYGGSITPASMLPLFVFSWIYGVPAGVTVGLIHGILQLTMGAYILHPMQFLLDYILPFSMLGFAGLFRKQDIKGLFCGIWVGGFLRYLMHTLAGIFFWTSNTPDGWNPVLWAFVYNAIYIGIDLIIVTVIAAIPQVSKQLVRLKRSALTE